MSSGLTGNYSIPYPVPTDPVNVTGDIEALATRIDNILQEEIEDTAASMWTSGGTFSNGLLAPTYNDSTGKMSMSLSQDLQTSASPTFASLNVTNNIFPVSDNTGVVGDASKTWSNGQFTALTIDGTLSVRTAIDLADSDTLQFGTSDDVKIFYNGSNNILDIELESAAVSLNITDNGTDKVVITKSNGNISTVGQLVSTVATGTPPLSVSSSTVVDNLNADLLDGQQGSYYQNASNINNGTLSVNRGGTGLTSYSVGDIVYASASTTLAKVAIGSNNHVLTSNGSSPVWTANTGTGNVVRSESPTLSGTPTAPTASASVNSTQIATTAFVQDVVSTLGGLPDQTGNSGKFLTTDGTNPSWEIVDLSSKADLASPTFTGTVTVDNLTATGTVSIVSPTAAGSTGPRDITMSTSSPSGGNDGDVWLQYS